MISFHKRLELDGKFRGHYDVKIVGSKLQILVVNPKPVNLNWGISIGFTRPVVRVANTRGKKFKDIKPLLLKAIQEELKNQACERLTALALLEQTLAMEKLEKRSSK